MRTLLILSPKLLIQTSPAEWALSVSAQTVLFTAGDDANFVAHVREVYGEVFERIEFFRNMTVNDRLEKVACDWHSEKPFDRIVTLAEIDVERAARLRAHLGIMGQTPENALVFRNKFEMKKRAAKAGVRVAPFRKVANALELLDFIATVGLPIVIKPLAGRGSSDTFVLHNEKAVEDFLESAFLSSTNRDPTLLAEGFVLGDVYHVDGLFLGGKPVVVSASRYVGNCLEFLKGGVLGSHTLEAKNPLKTRLEMFVLDLLTRVLPLEKESLFHVEIFVTPQNEIVLCEAACRMGGNSINDEVRLGYGIDIKMEYVRSQCLPDSVLSYAQPLKPSGRIGGRLLIPPRFGKLCQAPETCALPGVQKYQLKGMVGQMYKPMAFTNDEIAHFLIAADSEAEMVRRLSECGTWFLEKTEWQTQNL